MAQQVLGAVGAVIGGIYGGWAGAQWGWAIGSTIGALADPTVTKGPSIGDIAKQTSQEGIPRPIVFALSQPISGNIIATGEPRIVRRRKSQGKGGPKVETESVYRTYAIRVCEGPITRFVRVWRNGTLVYDVSDGALINFADNAWFQRNARFFLGGWDQMPSPDLETIFGVGTTPAHRGTAYLVMADEDLTDLRGAVPQYVFQVSNGPPAAIYDDTILLLQFEQADGSTNFQDTSPYLHTVEPTGPIEIDGEDPICGIGSGVASFGGKLEVPHHAVFDEISNSDFTVEFMFTPGNVELIDLIEKQAFTSLYPFSITGGWSGFEADGGLQNDPDYGDGTTVFSIQATVNINDGLPHHVALERWGAIFTLYIDGVGFSDVGNPGAAPPIVPGTYFGELGQNEAPIQVLSPSSSYAPPIVAKMDDVAITLRAKYMGDFTPPVCADGEALTLAEVVQAISDRAGAGSVVDVSQLDGEVRGFTITNSYPCSGALRALSEIFLFDPSNYDGAVHFIHRGGNSVATITEDDMVDDDEDIDESKRMDAIQVPRVLHLNYYDVAGGLATDKQTSERAGDRRSVGEISLQSAVVMSADEAATAVVINHKVQIEDQKGELHFCLPDKWLRLAVADPIIVQWQGRSERARITQLTTNDGYQQYLCLRDRQSAYTLSVEGIPSAPQTPPPSSMVGATLIEILDIHILRDSDDALGLGYYVAVSGLLEAWQGATVELSYDAGANYDDAQTTNVAAIMGATITALPDHPQAFPDEINTVSVAIETPLAELLETDLVGLLNGDNLAIIGDELVQFATADETSEGIWELGYFLRGRKGTATAAHAIGSRFVLLERGVLPFIPAQLTDIGRTLTFRATSRGATTDTGTVVSIVYTGRSQIERQSAYLQARRDGSDAIIEWQGVGRLGAGAQVAQGAYFLGYRVTLTDGVTTQTVDTLQQNLTQNVTAFSAPLTIRVQQRNQFTGLGPYIEAILL